MVEGIIWGGGRTSGGGKKEGGAGRECDQIIVDDPMKHVTVRLVINY